MAAQRSRTRPVNGRLGTPATGLLAGTAIRVVTGAGLVVLGVRLAGGSTAKRTHAGPTTRPGPAPGAVPGCR
ncbi:hypothetical protein [Nonomuraea sp. NPDC049709]|uniref:hypothetical protein n=1 Tax=Nonomuraea sp. NPDC049709 TaxID=3154736 RepID=UPI00341CE74F